MFRNSDLGHVREILDCIGAIDLAEAVVQRHDGDPDVGGVFLDAVRYRLVTISAAVESLSQELREDHPAVPWSDMARLGDLIGDDNDEVDPEMVSATIGEPVRGLRSACQAILGESVRVGEDEP
ncbi:MAG: HepT-like ribonuclease domain-containing protein [Actinomycetota bacterium]